MICLALRIVSCARSQLPGNQVECTLNDVAIVRVHGLRSQSWQPTQPKPAISRNVRIAVALTFTVTPRLLALAPEWNLGTIGSAEAAAWPGRASPKFYAGWGFPTCIERQGQVSEATQATRATNQPGAAIIPIIALTAPAQEAISFPNGFPPPSVRIPSAANWIETQNRSGAFPSCFAWWSLARSVRTLYGATCLSNRCFASLSCIIKEICLDLKTPLVLCCSQEAVRHCGGSPDV